MMDSMEMISIYENVATITDQMLSAARSGDWDLLSKLEFDCSSQVQTLRVQEVELELSPDLKNKKIQIIKKILADDKEIRNLTESWMAQLANIMRSSESNRKLSRTYGSS
ncbi:flagellar protein FliT [Undibacterium sp. Jales W-56]|uniref:flagellar protein FliT n=1 Tax=Undibacterium sp. Jales W-56 TaxID=2897325 RepID=UPI0021D23E26|nr:flagellar protein FliT [Undibacterium sp. Jales W-56]MCU6435381.1 flagellar protein FliT [Undibacterium sp. Jales W-56]